MLIFWGVMFEIDTMKKKIVKMEKQEIRTYKYDK